MLHHRWWPILTLHKPSLHVILCHILKSTALGSTNGMAASYFWRNSMQHKFNVVGSFCLGGVQGDVVHRDSLCSNSTCGRSDRKIRHTNSQLPGQKFSSAFSLSVNLLLLKFSVHVRYQICQWLETNCVGSQLSQKRYHIPLMKLTVKSVWTV